MTTEARQAPCAPWLTVEELLAWPPCSTADPQPDAAAVVEAIDVASWLLYERTGRRYPGICTTTVRPCRQPYEVDGRRPRGTGVPLWGWCSCGGAPDRATCQCGGLSEIRLGYTPIVAIDEVLVDGVALDPTEYRVDDHRWLVRLPDLDGIHRSWPCCQRMTLPTTEPDTFAVTFAHGINPPTALVRAARILACQLALAATPGANCQLPDRVSQVVRQGISASFVDPQDFFSDGMTGIYEVDLVLSTFPRLRDTRARVLSPGVPRTRRRTTLEPGVGGS